MKSGIALLIWLALSSLSSAQTLTYQSAGFLNTLQNPLGIPCPNIIESMLCLEMSITLNNITPLYPNMKNEMVEATINSMALGDTTFLPVYPSGTGQFYFTTDAAGKITGWNFVIDSIVDQLGDAVVFIGSGVWDYEVVGAGTFVAMTTGPGAWTQPPAVVPKVPLAFDCISNTYIPASNVAHFELEKYAGAATICQYPKAVTPSYLIKTQSGWVTLASLGLGN